MFNYTLDNKPQIVDDKGNTIIDLTRSIFKKETGVIRDFQIARMTDQYTMRPDLVSLSMYRTTENTEFILKYSGISNPFSLADDDILFIPNESTAKAQMQDYDAVPEKSQENNVRNIFKFKGKNKYKSDSSSYDALAQKEIKSVEPEEDTSKKDYIVPYISEDGKTAITIRNGKMFFGEDTGMKIAGTEMDEKIQNVINAAQTAMTDKCLVNGVTLADFIRASANNNAGQSYVNQVAADTANETNYESMTSNAVNDPYSYAQSLDSNGGYK